MLETRAARYSQHKERQAINFESKQIQRALKNLKKDRGYLIVLDSKGKKISSEALARFLKSKQELGINSFTFIIGGAYGLSDEIKKDADMILSLSDMTFTHEMTRLILVEQIYRAASINAGSPYHH